MKDFINQIAPQLVKWRRDFHQYPELGFMEYVTTYKLGKELERLGFQIYIGEDAMEREARLGLPSETDLKEKENEAIKYGVEKEWLDSMHGG